MVFTRGEVIKHKIGCGCFRCTKTPWNKGHKVEKTCPTCKGLFFVHPYRSKTAIYCSFSCAHKGKTAWNKGLTKTDPRVASYGEKGGQSRKGKPLHHVGQFQKKQVPWNKGMKYTEEQKSKLDISGLSEGRVDKKGKIRVINYANIHYWVRVNKGKAKKCSNCGAVDAHIEWANIDHEYKLNLDDYIELCKRCHTDFDMALRQGGEQI